MLVTIEVLLASDISLFELARGAISIPFYGEIPWRAAWAHYRTGDSTWLETDLSVLNQGVKPWGALRDKSVQHYKLNGELRTSLFQVLHEDFESGQIAIGQGHTRICAGALEVPPHQEGSGLARREWESCEYWWDVSVYTFNGMDAILIGRVHHNDRYYVDAYGVRHLGSEEGCGFLIGQTTWSYRDRFRSFTYLRAAGSDPGGSWINVQTEAWRGPVRTVQLRLGNDVELLRQLQENFATTIEDADWLCNERPLPHSVVQLASTAEQRIRQIERDLSSLRPGPLAPLDYEWGPLAVDCLNQVRPVTSSVLFLIFDVKDLRGIAMKIREVVRRDVSLHTVQRIAMRNLRALKGRKRALKATAREYLTWEFGVETFAADCRRLYDGLTRNFHKVLMNGAVQRLHSRRNWTIVDGHRSIAAEAVFTVETARYPTGFLGRAQELVSDLKALGIYPGLTDLEDIIPYSFVAGWITDVGGFVQSVQTDMDLHDYFPIHYWMGSLKFTESINVSMVFPTQGISGHLERIQYDRVIDRDIALVVPSFHLGALSTDRWVKSGALAVNCPVSSKALRKLR